MAVANRAALARQRRARYSRVNQPVGNLLVNEPDGFPYNQALYYVGSDRFSDLPWGESVTGYPMGSLAAVTRAESLISNTLASLPWRLLTGGLSPIASTTETPAPRWITDPTLLRPDARYTSSPATAATRYPRSVFWAQWIRSALILGVGYLLFQEDNSAQPMAGTLRVLNPNMVTAQFSEVYEHVNRKIGDETNYVETDADGRFTLGGIPYRLIELNNPLSQPDEYGVSEGVLRRHARELGLANQAVSYGRSMFRAGVPAGYLKINRPNVSEQQAKSTQKIWLDAHGGDSRSIAVLSADTEFSPLQFSPVDMALIEARRFSLIDIANAFGVPVYLLNGTSGDSTTYSNTESRSLDFKTWTLGFWASGIEEVLSALLPQSEWVTVDFRGLLRADTKTRYEAYQVAINAGFLTIEEVRNIENLPPMTANPEGSLV